MLEELWEMADFHKWYPNRKFDRTLGTLRRCLGELATDIDIGKTPLAKVLLVPAWESSLQISTDNNLARLKAMTPTEHGAAIVVGRLENLIRSKFNQDAAGLRISLLGQPLWMTPELTARIERQFAQELSEIQLKDRQIMVICTVFRKGETLKAEDVGLLRVSQQFIPADSGYELEVIAKLVRESRQFRKPVRLRGGKILPDFVLTDCEEPVFLEVFGMSTPEYLARKKEKAAFYSSAGYPFWSWAPDEQSVIPDLPAAKKSAQGS